MYCDQRSQYIKPKSKKNSFQENFMRKYGMCFGQDQNALEQTQNIFLLPNFTFWTKSKKFGPVQNNLDQSKIILDKY